MQNPNAHVELTDQDIFELFCEPTINSEAVGAECSEDSGDNEETGETESIPSEYEKLTQIANIMCWLDNGDEAAELAVRGLRRIQRTLKDLIAEKERTSTIQTHVDNYFTQRG